MFGLGSVAHNHNNNCKSLEASQSHITRDNIILKRRKEGRKENKQIELVVSFLKIYSYMCTYVCMSIWHMCVQVHMEARGAVRSLGAGLRNDCELPNMGADKQT